MRPSQQTVKSSQGEILKKSIVLISYLAHTRQRPFICNTSFIAQTNSDAINSHCVFKLMCNLVNSCPESVSEEDGGDWPLDIDDLLRFSYQVAQGLDFLSNRNVSDFYVYYYFFILPLERVYNAIERIYNIAYYYCHFTTL